MFTYNILIVSNTTVRVKQQTNWQQIRSFQLALINYTVSKITNWHKVECDESPILMICQTVGTADSQASLEFVFLLISGLAHRKYAVCIFYFEYLRK